MMRPQYSCAGRSSSASSKLGMHKDSHLISKTTPSKPNVRIIHVFAPEIIKTDVANFRDLVQNLTGKPAVPTALPEPNHKVKSSTRSVLQSKKMENSMQIIRGERDRVKEEIQDDMMWRSSSSATAGDHDKTNGFLDGFSDLDGFIEEFSEFPAS